jgi:hypothetical protein
MLFSHNIHISICTYKISGHLSRAAWHPVAIRFTALSKRSGNPRSALHRYRNGNNGYLAHPCCMSRAIQPVRVVGQPRKMTSEVTDRPWLHGNCLLHGHIKPALRYRCGGVIHLTKLKPLIYCMLCLSRLKLKNVLISQKFSLNM